MPHGWPCTEQDLMSSAFSFAMKTELEMIQHLFSALLINQHLFEAARNESCLESINHCCVNRGTVHEYCLLAGLQCKAQWWRRMQTGSRYPDSRVHVHL